ncbi:MAG: hypothetical protein HY744_04710 [Deltaproteobacteria bacterium]|nr:hypothetical protein [Deltaproteobacteria bacterium]
MARTPPPQPPGRRAATAAIGRAAETAAEPWHERVDLDGLLVALVLVPGSYSRNRFSGLYEWPPARRVRRRAARLRAIARELASVLGAAGGRVERRAVGADVVLGYRLPKLGLRCRSLLTALEADHPCWLPAGEPDLGAAWLLDALLRLLGPERRGRRGPAK